MSEQPKTTIEKYTDILCDLLAERLPFSRTWRNVSFEHKASKYIVVWFDSKHMDDPEGKKAFREHAGPYTLEGIHKEIVKQNAKLDEDAG